MSLIQAVAMGVGFAPITLSAPWADISGAINILDPPYANANVTLTFQGAARQIRVDTGGLDTSGSDFEYRVNSGTYTNCPDETTFSVSSGDTLNFRCNAETVTSATISIYDNTHYPSVPLDQFDVLLDVA